MWECEFLETEFESGWNFENDLRVRDFKERLSCENWDFGSWILKEIRIVSYLRNRNYESWCVKIGNLRNHLKADFMEITNKMVIKIMMITNEQLGKYDNWNIRNWKLSSKIGHLRF